VKLSPGRYLLTATIDHNLLGLGLPAGTRVTAVVVFRASGVHSYRLTKIAPNPSAYALEQGAFEYDGWEDGHAALVKELLGHKIDIVVTAHSGGALEVSAVHADTGIPMFDASGAWRRAKGPVGPWRAGCAERAGRSGQAVRRAPSCFCPQRADGSTAARTWAQSSNGWRRTAGGLA
jgi:hypothetical protein